MEFSEEGPKEQLKEVDMSGLIAKAYGRIWTTLACSYLIGALVSGLVLAWFTLGRWASLWWAFVCPVLLLPSEALFLLLASQEVARWIRHTAFAALLLLTCTIMFLTLRIDSPPNEAIGVLALHVVVATLLGGVVVYLVLCTVNVKRIPVTKNLSQ